MSPTVVVRVKFRPWRIVLVSHTNGRPTGTCLGRNRHGSGARPQKTCLVALHSAGRNPRCGAGRLSFLNKC